MVGALVSLVFGVPLVVYINQVRKARKRDAGRLEEIQQQLEEKRLAKIQSMRNGGKKSNG